MLHENALWRYQKLPLQLAYDLLTLVGGWVGATYE